MKKTIEITPINKRFKNFKCGSEQVYVEAYPKKGKHDRSDIDVLRLTVKEADTGDIKEIDMTPDEALEISGHLNTAAMFWIMNYKPYWETFMKRKRELDKKLLK